ncbi:RNA polymerase sigma factor [Steroidobacter flavus]|uniref:RNA polymerase sigma factor n=1 Tax=Steroidobacter flavus TaxID=1842136 RepID=A0ABV8T2W9_9GAMM
MTALSHGELMDVFIGLRAQIERILASRVGCPQTAADLAQDMYFRVQRVAAELPNEEEARRYLLRMATNAATDHFRVEGRRAEILSGLALLFEGVESDPAQSVINGDQMRVIESALTELPPKCREVLFLSRVEGMTHAEIATKLGVSVSLVEKYMVRALLHCRTRLLQQTN